MKLPDKLETERLIIRPYTERDRDDFIEFMLCSQVTDYLNFTEEQKTSEGAKELLDMTLSSYRTSTPLFALVITKKECDRFIGSCGFSPLDEKKNCECFYALFPQYWGQGLATEAMITLFNYGFEQLKINEIIAHINKDNPRSLRVVNKLGMKETGTVEFKGIPEQGKLFTLNIGTSKN
ncbi:MAG: GNAT family N-acetyltransferase [Pleurocapsa sp.]